MPGSVLDDYLASYAGSRYIESVPYVRSYPADLARLAPLLPELHTAVQIIVGRDDPYGLADAAGALNRELPTSRLDVLNTAHCAWKILAGTPASPPTGSPARPKRMRRFLIRALVAVVAGVATAFIVYQTSVQPGAALVRAVFQGGPHVVPPAGFAATEQTVTEVRVPIHAADAPAAAIDVYRPRASSARPRPVILWIHGGGFLANSAADFRDWGILLAHQGYVVALLDYSLAPETHYPGPVRQGNAALAYLEQNAARYGGDPDRVAVGGDSAGAQIGSELAAVESNPRLATAMALTPGLPVSHLRAAVLYCGLYDMSTVGGTGFPGLRTYLWSYTGTRNWLTYPQINQLSATRQVTAAYPPTYLTVGDADPFRTQATELAGVLRSRGVPVTTLFWHGQKLGHEYQFHFDHPQAEVSFQRTLQFLAQRLTGTAGHA